MPAPYKVVYPRHYKKSDGSTQTQWVTIGSAFPSRDGDGFDCNLEAYPLPNANGEARFMIRRNDSDARREPGPGGPPQGERQNFGGTHRDQFGGNAATGGQHGHTQAAEAYYPGKPDDKLPF